MSKKIRTLVVENEIVFLESFKKMLDTFTEIELIDTCSDIHTAQQYIEKYKPDLVFLDIELNQGNAFELLSNCEKIEFEVVFTTAFNQYAINAIKMSALDYILKPFGRSEIEFALAKLLKKKQSEVFIQHLVSNIAKQNDQEKSIAIHTFDGISFLNLSDILFCKADNNYTVFQTVGGQKLTVSSPLKKYDDILHDKLFFRVHQSYLINLKHVLRYSKKNGGELVLNKDFLVPIARRKKEELLQKLESLSI
jgi:two-component system LytT family response regulator